MKLFKNVTNNKEEFQQSFRQLETILIEKDYTPFNLDIEDTLSVTYRNSDKIVTFYQTSMNVFDIKVLLIKERMKTHYFRSLSISDIQKVFN